MSVSRKLPALKNALKNERAYERALKEIDGLMDAEFGTPEGERLDALVTQVESYEAEHYNMDKVWRLIERDEARRTTSWLGELRRMVVRLFQPKRRARSVRLSK